MTANTATAPIWTRDNIPGTLTVNAAKNPITDEPIRGVPHFSSSKAGAPTVGEFVEHTRAVVASYRTGLEAIHTGEYEGSVTFDTALGECVDNLRAAGFAGVAGDLADSDVSYEVVQERLAHIENLLDQLTGMDEALPPHDDVEVPDEQVEAYLQLANTYLDSDSRSESYRNPVTGLPITTRDSETLDDPDEPFLAVENVVFLLQIARQMGLVTFLQMLSPDAGKSMRRDDARNLLHAGWVDATESACIADGRNMERVLHTAVGRAYDWLDTVSDEDLPTLALEAVPFSAPGFQVGDDTPSLVPSDQHFTLGETRLELGEAIEAIEDRVVKALRSAGKIDDAD